MLDIPETRFYVHPLSCNASDILDYSYFPSAVAAEAVANDGAKLEARTFQITQVTFTPLRRAKVTVEFTDVVTEQPTMVDNP